MEVLGVTCTAGTRRLPTRGGPRRERRRSEGLACSSRIPAERNEGRVVQAETHLSDVQQGGGDGTCCRRHCCSVHWGVDPPLQGCRLTRVDCVLSEVSQSCGECGLCTSR